MLSCFSPPTRRRESRDTTSPSIAASPRTGTSSRRCRVTTLSLAGDELQVTVRPERGAELCSLLHCASGTEFLFRAPWGVPDGDGFLDRYAGAWQELFPSARDETSYRGRAIPLHGEVAALPWD